ncbi:hypothetical protein ACHQM5_010657 [Ranunculus cassubicifolius]
MEVPFLRLMVESGPKEGETLEKKPGTKVRIGRVIKGNNFTIKDDGISSRHLFIEVKDFNWVIYDLDTSNGTFLNGVQIEPNTPFVLKNGDFIKIGELTSIKVVLGEDEEEKRKQTKGLKKIEKSGGATSSVNVDADVKNVKEVKLDGGGGPVRRNPRRGNVVAEKEQVSVAVVETRGGRGRGRKNAAPKNDVVETIVDGVAEVNIGENSNVSKLSVGDNSKSAAEIIVYETQEVGVGSKGKKVAEFLKIEVGDSSKGKSVASDEADDIPANTENSTNEKNMMLEKLNKMTLGEWLDYLEVYLVKQINKETDVIIDGMRAKVEQYKKFMSEQQKLNRKPPVS